MKIEKQAGSRLEIEKAKELGGAKRKLEKDFTEMKANLEKTLRPCFVACLA